MKYDAVDAGMRTITKVNQGNLYRSYLPEENLKVSSYLVLEVLYANRGSLALLFPVTLTPDPQTTLFILVQTEKHRRNTHCQDTKVWAIDERKH